MNLSELMLLFLLLNLSRMNLSELMLLPIQLLCCRFYCCVGLLLTAVVALRAVTTMLPSSSVVCCGGLFLGVEDAEVVTTPIVPFPRLPSLAYRKHTQEAGFGTRTLRTTGSAFFSHYISIVTWVACRSHTAEAG
jgi:hypothetical protein